MRLGPLMPRLEDEAMATPLACGLDAGVEQGTGRTASTEGRIDVEIGHPRLRRRPVQAWAKRQADRAGDRPVELGNEDLGIPVLQVRPEDGSLFSRVDRDLRAAETRHQPQHGLRVAWLGPADHYGIER